MRLSEMVAIMHRGSAVSGILHRSTSLWTPPSVSPPVTGDTLSTIRFFPRPDWAPRLAGAQFQGSKNANPADLNSGTWETLYTVTGAPAYGWNSVNLTADLRQYPNLRVLMGGYGNVAEVEWYDRGAKIVRTGAFGTPGSFGGGSATYDKAIDGDPSTYFDSAQETNNVIGITWTPPATATPSPAPGASDAIVQLVAEGTDNKSYTAFGRTFATAPKTGNLLFSAVAADKSLQNPFAPAGFTLLGHWQGTGGVGLALAVKKAVGDETGEQRWSWGNATGANVVLAEVSRTNPAPVGSAVVNGTESNVTSLGLDVPVGSTGDLILAVAGVDSSTRVDSTWRWPEGPNWAMPSLRGNGMWTNEDARDTGRVALAWALGVAPSAAAVSVQVNAQGPADQHALIAQRIKST